MYGIYCVFSHFLELVGGDMTQFQQRLALSELILESQHIVMPQRSWISP